MVNTAHIRLPAIVLLHKRSVFYTLCIFSKFHKRWLPGNNTCPIFFTLSGNRAIAYVLTIKVKASY
jgi:hypothetical protein